MYGEGGDSEARLPRGYPPATTCPCLNTFSNFSIIRIFPSHTIRGSNIRRRRRRSSRKKREQGKQGMQEKEQEQGKHRENTRSSRGGGERVRGALLRARPFNCVPRRVAAERQGMREGRGRGDCCWTAFAFIMRISISISIGFVLVSCSFRLNSIRLLVMKLVPIPPSPFSLPPSRTQ